MGGKSRAAKADCMPNTEESFSSTLTTTTRRKIKEGAPADFGRHQYDRIASTGKENPRDIWEKGVIKSNLRRLEKHEFNEGEPNAYKEGELPQDWERGEPTKRKMKLNNFARGKHSLHNS